MIDQSFIGAPCAFVQYAVTLGYISQRVNGQCILDGSAPCAQILLLVRACSVFHLSVCFMFFNDYILRWRGGATDKAFGLAISRSRVQILLEATLHNNLRQVVYTYVPLSPSSITWYRPKGR